MSLIQPTDGKRIVKFIKEQMGYNLPKTGLLAGQSVCSVMLYLLGKSNKVEINDLDIFYPQYRQLKFWSFNPHTWVPKTREPQISIHRKTMAIPMSVIEELKKETKIKDDEYREITLTGSKGSLYARNMKEGLLKNVKLSKLKRENFLGFHSNPYENKDYKINSVLRKDIYNYIFIKNKFHENSIDPLRIINSFDLNCTQVAIDLSTERIYYTRYFEHFLHSMQLMILKIDRPHHTIIRYFQKREQHDYYGNDELATMLATTYTDLSQLSECSPLREAEYGLIDKEAWQFEYFDKRITGFGEGYIDKYNSNQEIKKISKLVNNRHKIRYLVRDNISDEEHKYRESKTHTNIGKLNYRQDGLDYILSGQHRNELEKAFNIKMIGYVNYIRSTLPVVMHDAYGSFKRKNSARRLEILTQGKFNTRTKFNPIKSQRYYNLSDVFSGNTTENHRKAIEEFQNMHNVGHHFYGLSLEEQYQLTKRFVSIEKKHPHYVHMLEGITSELWLKMTKEEMVEFLRHKYVVYSKELKKRGRYKEEPDIPDTTINNIYITELISQAQLQEEAKVLKHCCWMFGHKIKSRTSFILSFRKSDFVRSTLEIYPVFYKNSKGIESIKWKKRQFRKEKNKVPDLEMQNALKKFMLLINEEGFIQKQISELKPFYNYR